jgi:3-hydroxybutyryl-CoA dehydrogenase
MPIDVETIHQIGVIGSGTMGAGIAQVFLGAGCRVFLDDTSPDRVDAGAERIRKGLERWEAKAQIPSAAEAFARLIRGPDLLLCQSCQWVVEAIVEDWDEKAALFRTLGRLCHEETVLSSNTSSISITALGTESGRPERVVGMHFFNPPPVMRLVEVVHGLQTAPEVTAAASALAQRVGKVPVTSKDRPGFLSNRILMPMLNEAFRALEEGVGTAEDIDQVMKLGMNHPMGPLELADLIGLDVCLAILEILHREFGDPRFHPCPLLKKYVEAGWLGRKTGRGFYCYEGNEVLR